MIRKLVIVIVLSISAWNLSYASYVLPMPDSLKYPLKDRAGDYITDPSKNSVDLSDPSNIVRTVDYDPETNTYIVHEKIGDIDYRPPMYLTYEEYVKYVEKQQKNDYVKSRNAGINLVEKKGLIPPIDTKSKLADRLFGNTSVDIRPSGNIELTLGGNRTKIANPTLPVRNQKNGGFDFDMNMNINVIGKIGNKLQLNLGYNTQGGFSFGNDINNLIKLQYSGEEDDIIQELAAGTVSLPLPTQLITSTQAMFGFKAKLRFGRLTTSILMAQQKSKKESITIDNGVQIQKFEISTDRYDANRHFFLAQYFRDNYDKAMANLPNIQSIVNVNRIEVWVTNRNGATTNVRDVVGFMDLGETDPYSNLIHGNPAIPLPSNQSNDLYNQLTAGGASVALENRSISNVTPFIQGTLGLTPVQDYEKVYARKLQPSEFTFDPLLGYISLNNVLNPNEVLAVAYEYTINGQKYQVGEFASQVQGDSNDLSKVLYLKLLKATSARPTLPIWNLMMKNIYSLGAYQVNSEDFFLDIYYNDPGNGLKRYLPKGNIQGKPLIRLLNLDNLNNQGDAQPDGVFDFLNNITIKPQNGRIIFPVVEPFGSYLQKQFENYGDGAIAPNYVYNQLYDSTQVIASQYPEYNRFVIKGSYKSAGGGDINLNAFNIPPGSVSVTAGGIKLTEGVDYTVDYNLGRVKIINESISKSGNQIKIDFENGAQFASQQKSVYGLRFDYRASEKLKFGATVLHMSERPYTQKVNLGEDPIRNTMLGFDMKYNSDVPWLTKALDKLPIYSTKDMSTFTFYGEVARLQPGHSKVIGKAGNIYIDDFEGSSNGYDIRQPVQSWRMASTPNGSKDASGRVMFPESSRFDSIYNFNRAKLSWYNIDPCFNQNQSCTPKYIQDNPADYITHYTRQILQSEVFPNRSNNTINNTLQTFDLSFDPTLRGPYNFESKPFANAFSYGIDDSGHLNNPKTRWGGIMRSLDNTDFEASNVEYIEFWVMDPFIGDRNSSRAGNMYLNLGTISEDILKDSRLIYENGIVCDTNQNDRTEYGQVPRLAPIVNAFNNDPDIRKCQDVGYDGLGDNIEINRWGDFLSNIRSSITLNPIELTKLENDPANDDYKFFKDATYDADKAQIIARYQGYNGPEGNSPVVTGDSAFSNAATNTPDLEDLNKDNTLNENEEYYEYRIPIFPGMDESNNKYIISHVVNGASQVSFGSTNVDLPEYTWYQFRIPIRQYDEKIGNIQDFRSIQFLRLFLTEFEKPLTLRFAKFELIRNQWRVYDGVLKNGTDANPIDPDVNTTFFQTAVNFEENSEKLPVNYVLPPNIVRENGIGQNANTTIQLNEQALSVKACNLQDGDSRALYKNINLDIRNYKKIQMTIHAEESAPIVVDNDMTSFIRLGSDFKDNYYQYEVPLKVTPILTPPATYNNDVIADREVVWPLANNIDIALSVFTELKQERNLKGIPLTVPYSKKDDQGRILTIVGNPDLGLVATMMLGVKNPSRSDPFNPKGDAGDDGSAKCSEIWFNELRLSGLDEGGGTATLATVNVKLADLGNISLATKYHSIGFGQIEQKVDQRFRDEYVDYDFTTNVEIGKFIPKKAGFRIPFYGSYAQKFSTPQYDPYQLDIKTKDQFALYKTTSGDTLKNYRETIRTIETRRGFNFTNVRIVPQSKSKKLWPWSPNNFNFTYAFTEVYKSDPFTEYNGTKNYLGVLGYSYSPQPKYMYPFKKGIKSSNKWWDLIKDINLNLIPSTLSFNTDINRRFGELRLRVIGDEEFPIAPSYNKFFTWNRNYVFRWSPLKSLNIDYAATNNARIDEPDGKIDTKEKKKEIWDHVLAFGRNTNYTQSLSATYNLPINKIPLLDWVQVRGSYASSYTWTASPQLRDKLTNKFTANPLGNVANNSQNISLNGDFNIKKLYDKLPFLKPYNNPNPNQGDAKKRKAADEAIKKAREKLQTQIDKATRELNKLKENILDLKVSTKKTPEEKATEIKVIKKQIKDKKKAIKKLKKDLYSKQKSEIPGVALLIEPLLALKKVSVTYSENRATTISGLMNSPRVLGVSSMNSPGYDFTFGNQPGMTPFKTINSSARNQWLEDAADKGWISTDTLLNRPFIQTYAQTFNVKANFEPWRDIKIDLEWNKSYTINHSQMFKKQNSTDPFEHFFPKDMGTYSITTIPIKGLFKNFDTTFNSQLYKNFEANRPIVSDRISHANPNANPGETYVNPDGTVNTSYKSGYGPKSQEVLIPAFLAAYMGKDVNKVTLNPFKSLPLPNWRLTYNGLTNFAWAKKIFASFSITHAYTSTMNINSFESNLDYSGDGNYLNSQSKDTLNNNYFSLYRMPNIVINEAFQPLIGVNMSFKNNLTMNFDFKKSRIVTMSFSDYQLNEIKSTAYTLGFGYKIRGLKIPLKIKGKPLKLENDLNFKFDFSYRDNITVTSRIDQGIHEPTTGSRILSFLPSIDYTVSKRINVRLFFDWSRTKPYTSSSYPITTARGGVTLKLSLNPN